MFRNQAITTGKDRCLKILKDLFCLSAALLLFPALPAAVSAETEDAGWGSAREAAVREAQALAEGSPAPYLDPACGGEEEGFLATLAEETVTLPLEMRYDQTAAREMLACINEFRTDGNAWVWMEGDEAKKENIVRPALVYDYTLEQVAMRRAAEIAVSFSHTRPDGRSCFTAFPSGYAIKGENLAAGHLTPEEAFEALCETDRTFAGQGHRRNMLGIDDDMSDIGYTCVGFGHVIYNGVHYWAQVFGQPTQGAGETEPYDGTTVVEVETALSKITSVGLSPLEDHTMYCGEKEDLDGRIQVRCRISTQWPSGMVSLAAENVTFASSDPSVLAVTDSVLTAETPGTAILTVTAETFDGEKTTNAVVTVEPVDISLANVAAPSDVAYTGEARTPKPKLSRNGTTLVEGRDYTLSYEGNTEAGTAKAVITGIGNYTGEQTCTFRILPKTPAAKIDASVLTYSGRAQSPSVTVKDGAVTLREGKDYTVSASGTEAGSYTGTVTFKGNYTGKETFSFTIRKYTLTYGNVSGLEEEYETTGDGITPPVTVRIGSRTLKENEDYTVSYENNTEPGTAEMLITGTGSCGGTVALNFRIVESLAVMYRLYNPNSGEHFYTANEAEKDYLDSIGWNYEGIGWTAPKRSETPVYRLYNPNAGDHHYTMSEGEMQMLVAVGWNYEGIGWYSDDRERVPLYRQYNPNAVAGAHNYTANKAENDYLASIGWNEEGIGWYAAK